MRLLRQPVAQFLLFGLLLIVLISVGTTRLAQEAAEDEALAEARALNAVLARSTVDTPGLEQALLKGRRDRSIDGGSLDFFDRKVQALLLIDYMERVNIWAPSGRLLYSNAYTLIGARFPLSEGQQRVLADGGTDSEISDPESGENAGVAGTPGLQVAEPQGQVRIFTRVTATDRGTGKEVPLLFEGYYTLGDLQDRREEIYDSFRWITIGGPVLLVLLVTPILWILTRRVTSGAKERERLLHSSLDASDAERRRIARDLHDGVVQDLAGTAFAVSAVARDPNLPSPVQVRLDEAGDTLRDGLKSLRSLLAEIHPPEVQAEGLASALSDLIAPAGAAGVNASVSVEGAETATDEKAALVWRVAQEAVRNALRHADASTLAVTVRGDGRRLMLEVVDDGLGFDPRERAREDSFGLRGLRSLVADAGGTIDVRSSSGEGTTVVMEVAAL